MEWAKGPLVLPSPTTPFLWFVTLPRGTRFLATCGGGTLPDFPTFSKDWACLFAREDAVDEEKDERRFWVDIFTPTTARTTKKEKKFYLLLSTTKSLPFFWEEEEEETGEKGQGLDWREKERRKVYRTFIRLSSERVRNNRALRFLNIAVREFLLLQKKNNNNKF